MLDTFENCRARFQRLANQSVSSAWVTRLTQFDVAVRFEEPLDAAVGEKFLFQLTGLESDAYFLASLAAIGYQQQEVRTVGSAAKVVQLDFEQAQFNLLSSIQFRDSQQLPRKVMSDLRASFTYQGTIFDAIVIDGSPQGVGLLSFQELQKGDVVEIRLSGNQFQVEFFAEVKHCRPESALTGAFRVGLQFRQEERIASSSWKKLIKPF